MRELRQQWSHQWGKDDEVLATMIGKTYDRVKEDSYDGNDAVVFESDSWDIDDILFGHDQNCCESFHLEDTIGNLEDLAGSPITMAEVVTNADPPTDIEDEEDGWSSESETWTFYKFATVKGYVTLRFLGTSNGYYSEEVDIFVNHKPKGPPTRYKVETPGMRDQLFAIAGFNHEEDRVELAPIIYEEKSAQFWVWDNGREILCEPDDLDRFWPKPQEEPGCSSSLSALPSSPSPQDSPSEHGE